MSIEGDFNGMSYMDALNECNLSDKTLDDLYAFMDRLTKSDELELLKYPHYQQKLIELLIKPDAILVCNLFMEPCKPFFDRVLIYKDNIRAPLKSRFPNEYRFMKLLTGT
jgi:hypothetical protein